MLINCTNKGCLKSSNALLDPETKEVVCQECGKPIIGISEPMKRTLKSHGQVIKTNVKKAFLLLCKACNANREVVLNEHDETVCKVCKSPVTIQASFKLAMQEAGHKLEKLQPAQEETPKP